ncbi:membrane-anchored ubiquitin-fold protein 3-like isoform X1 [Vigna unguiculata]|uniref:membrane-anchored ubiquitin-fold protein 3-like isoform X1 n=1 Tax=Vigna unguiculata TaxID=3917 RepID=UPI00101707C8|nr:membrane-anchored ubiquitin-fold protein 3-like isoform X1 [Vigna unguiculata]XP_027920281.1 membrane-anchored ubiquitin-fold protein 3-like isoform X1 [Vigna unguiculata]XP_027920282.1 membrane-anchored ubiquitin-fold protein 3-like isoform X1 [Vigna unguiculata]
MPEEDLVDIKFRLYDGSDIGPFRYSSAATVDMLKQRIVSDWPKGKTIVPKSANEVKLINSGQILENNKTVGQCKVLFGEIAGNIIIMHVVVQPSLAKTKAEHVSEPISTSLQLDLHDDDMAY